VAKLGSAAQPGAAGGGTARRASDPGQWALYWGVAVSAASAPGMALLFAPVTTMSARSDLFGRWSALLRFFPLAHRIFGVMVGLALAGCLFALLGLRAESQKARRGIPSQPPGETRHSDPAGSASRFALILGILNLLFWGSALALSFHLATIYRAWGITLGLH
jgi:hypothetical protein